MSAFVACQGCGLQHSPRAGGLCPRCGSRALAATSAGVPGVDRHELRARKEADGEGSRGALAAVLGIGVSIAIIAAILMSTGWLVISVGMIKLVIVGVGLVLGIGAKVSSR